MAFLIKPVNGQEQRLELAQIHEALQSGAINEQWLVRDERQDFWYSVGKLIGKVSSHPVELFCPHCRSPIPARRIQIGLPVACPQCAREVTVPDPEALLRRQRDLQRLPQLGVRVWISGLILAAGATLTIFNYLDRKQQGGWILFWGALAFGLGTFPICLLQYLELKRKLQRPPK